VLLKNENTTLPLAPKAVRTLALIGPHANGSLVWLGGPNYHGDSDIGAADTPLLAARKALPHAEVLYTQGCDVDSASTAGFASAVAAAARADAVVLMLGTDQTIENEGRDARRSRCRECKRSWLCVSPPPPRSP